jgi:protein arginine kinase
MTIDELTRNRSAWLRADTPMTDIVISSRIRLARNVAGFPFLPKADNLQRREIYRLLREGIDRAGVGQGLTFVDLEGVDEIDRQILVERHLISRQHAESEGSRAVAFSADQTISLMINEEDHLRMQVLRSGLQLDECWAAISAIDNAIEQHVDFAFHARFGYLTACPTNVVPRGQGPAPGDPRPARGGDRGQRRSLPDVQSDHARQERGRDHQ